MAKTHEVDGTIMIDNTDDFAAPMAKEIVSLFESGLLDQQFFSKADISRKDLFQASGEKFVDEVIRQVNEAIEYSRVLTPVAFEISYEKTGISPDDYMIFIRKIGVSKEGEAHD